MARCGGSLRVHVHARGAQLATTAIAFTSLRDGAAGSEAVVCVVTHVQLLVLASTSTGAAPVSLSSDAHASVTVMHHCERIMNHHLPPPRRGACSGGSCRHNAGTVAKAKPEL